MKVGRLEKSAFWVVLDSTDIRSQRRETNVDIIVGRAEMSIVDAHVCGIVYSFLEEWCGRS